MNSLSTLTALTLVFLAGCTSSYVAQALPGDHRANPKAPTTVFSLPPNPFKRAVSPRPMVSQARVEGEGKVIAVVPEGDQVVVEHGEIKGFMGAMTMGYKVQSPSLLQGLKAGDRIRFTMDTEKKIITNISKQ